LGFEGLFPTTSKTIQGPGVFANVSSGPYSAYADASATLEDSFFRAWVDYSSYLVDGTSVQNAVKLAPQSLLEIDADTFASAIVSPQCIQTCESALAGVGLVAFRGTTILYGGGGAIASATGTPLPYYQFSKQTSEHVHIAVLNQTSAELEFTFSAGVAVEGHSSGHYPITPDPRQASAQFPIPEPDTYIILTCGLAAIAIRHRRRSKLEGGSISTTGTTPG
jgi:hypothetical protein